MIDLTSEELRRIYRSLNWTQSLRVEEIARYQKTIEEGKPFPALGTLLAPETGKMLLGNTINSVERDSEEIKKILLKIALHVAEFP